MRYAATVTAATLAFLLALAPHSALQADQQNARTIGAESGPTLTVDFSVLDAKGQPVTDLTPADIAVRIGGKARDVRALQLVRRDPPAAPGAAVPDKLPAPFVTNVNSASTNRSVFIIFDNETMTAGREQRVRDGVLALINALGPKDEAAILTVPHGGVATELTSDRSVLQRAVASLAGAAPSNETAEQSACRSVLTLQAIRSVLDQRAGTESPTDIVFVSSSLSGPRLGALSGTTMGRGNLAGCDLKVEEFTRLGTAASAARAHFYIIQPEQIRVASTTGDLDSPLAGLENIASLTGSTVWHMAGSDAPSFERVAVESSSYYAATVVLDPSDRAGATQQLSVKTSRPDITVVARPSITFGGGRSGNAPSPKDMLRTATPYRDTPLRVAAFVSRNAGDGKVKVVAMAESAAGNKLSAAAIGMYDAAGKLVGQWSADGAALGAPALITAFVQAPGQYRIRVAATDASGRAGSADVDINATLTPVASVLSLSSMLLGTQDATFAPKLQFAKEPQAAAYFELYGGKQGMPVSVNVELASTLNGPALATLQPKISGTSEADKYIIITPIALGTLPAGDYVIRAIVGLDGQPAVRIMRTLRKTQ